MDLTVRTGFAVGPEDSLALASLAEDLENASLRVSRIKTAAAVGTKDGGIIDALNVVGFGLTVLGTIISILHFWGKDHSYHVRIRQGKTVVDLVEVSPSDFAEIIAQLKTFEQNSPIEVVVTKIS
jgi:hypothetical protein